MSFRRDFITKPIFSWARGVLPAMSDTEREALEAGDVWWDADLFTGNPDWEKLLAVAPATLTPEEQAFLNGPVDELCAHARRLEDQLGMARPAARGLGLHQARKILRHDHSEGIWRARLLALCAFRSGAQDCRPRSVTAAVTVMVPNSLGPGELLMRFGTKEQQQRWLPRLADGREIPCFGLTSPEAGSDAASMIDSGIICKGHFDGKEVLGLRLNWHKRYITLGPVATLLGLAFKAYDPDHLVGSAGRTRHHRGADPDRSARRRDRRAPSAVDAGVPERSRTRAMMSSSRWITSSAARQRLGQGWKMLMTALAAGRGISLPSLSAAGAAYAARTTGAYARIREQFNVPIGKFEGIEEPLARIAGTAYLLDAARRLTCAALNQGHHPAVISGIMKLHATERMRIAIDDAMDIHGGKAVIDGPQNYMGNLYRSVPVGITVEGANILTRNLIVFGQGAIRAHPYLLEEMNALGEADRAKGLDAFDKAFWQHIGHSVTTLFRAWGRNWTGGLFAPAPDAGDATGFYRQLSRYSSAFALCADMALLTLGGALKRKEMLSARFGDILSELYLLSAALKRWQDEGRQQADFAALEWCMASGFRTIENRFAEILANLPNRFVAIVLEIRDPAVRRPRARTLRPRGPPMRPAGAGAVGGARPADGGFVACR